MPKLSSPFAGMKLSEQARGSSSAPDQKLFSPTKSPTRARSKPIRAGASRPEAEGLQETSPEVRPSVVPSVRTPVRRTITRYSFEFFQDQIESLRRYGLEEKARGEKGSMSQMVREAVDMYIAKRNRTED